MASRSAAKVKKLAKNELLGNHQKPAREVQAGARELEDEFGVQSLERIGIRLDGGGQKLLDNCMDVMDKNDELLKTVIGFK